MTIWMMISSQFLWVVIMLTASTGLLILAVISVTLLAAVLKSIDG